MTRRPLHGAAMVLLALAGSQLAACSSIDRSAALQSAQLAVGKATKSEVVNAIGLPAQAITDDVQHVEFWAYTGKPELTSYFIPLPVAQTGTVVHYVNVGPQLLASKAPVVLVCAFDASGRLVDVKRPEEVR